MDPQMPKTTPWHLFRAPCRRLPLDKGRGIDRAEALQPDNLGLPLVNDGVYGLLNPASPARRLLRDR